MLVDYTPLKAGVKGKKRPNSDFSEIGGPIYLKDFAFRYFLSLTGPMGRKDGLTGHILAAQ